MTTIARSQAMLPEKEIQLIISRVPAAAAKVWKTSPFHRVVMMIEIRECYSRREGWGGPLNCTCKEPQNTPIDPQSAQQNAPHFHERMIKTMMWMKMLGLRR